MSNYNDIKDNEIRIIGNADQLTTTLRKPIYRRWWFWATVVALAVLAALLIAMSISRKSNDAATKTVENIESEPVAPTVVKSEPAATVLVSDTSVNDVQMRIYTPVNAVPELCIGYPDPNDNTLVLAFQAADIRADNHEILGAYVLKGDMLSRGRSKKGFCAIIDGKIQLGMAESTPLLEEATEKEGYFFRQYPLVLDGQMVQNKPKNKALRHALCEYNGTIVTVSSMGKESLHDFAQALADLGVQNAIYLIGAESYGFCRTQSNETPETVFWGEKKNDKMFEKVNFIVWRAVE
jgi:hypothetical protein